MTRLNRTVRLPTRPDKLYAGASTGFLLLYARGKRAKAILADTKRTAATFIQSISLCVELSRTSSEWKRQGGSHCFGTDGLGRDQFSRFLFWSKALLFAGLLATALALAWLDGGNDGGFTVQLWTRF